RHHGEQRTIEPDIRVEVAGVEAINGLTCRRQIERVHTGGRARAERPKEFNLFDEKRPGELRTAVDLLIAVRVVTGVLTATEWKTVVADACGPDKNGISKRATREQD